MAETSLSPWRRAQRRGVSNTIAAAAFVVVILVAAVAGALVASRGSSNSVSSTTMQTTTASSILSTPSQLLTTTSTTQAPGSIVVVPADSNFTVGAQSCKYFQFNDEVYNANFSGSFTANPEVAMYLLNSSMYSLAQASGSSIVFWTLATTGSDNQTYDNHLMVTGYSFNQAIPQSYYYDGFCDWTNNPTVVSTNSTGIIASWP